MTEALGFRNVVDEDVAESYRARGWWGDVTLVDYLRRHVDTQPDRDAFRGDRGVLSWHQVDRVSDRIASTLVAVGCAEGDRVAVMMADGGAVHCAYLGAEKAGVTVVGIGSRAGAAEVAHLLASTAAGVLLTECAEDPLGPEVVRAALTMTEHRVEVVCLPEFESDVEAPISNDGVPVEEPSTSDLDGRRVGPDDLFFINSTSGTTGLPKCVLHTQNRWLYFHQVAVEHGGLSPSEITMSLVPAPFGFGLWTAHFTPIVLGATSVTQERFDASAALELIESERVTMLSCVSTQFLMMLHDVRLAERDLSSLRVMFTGGEAVPTDRAKAFEELTGATVLQFYGSNETGVLSGTRLSDDLERRTTTAGRVLQDMSVRLYDPDGVERVSGQGRPACRGPATAVGYLDERANRDLFTTDGWMLMGDLCSIDDEGWLTVTGRISDFIIRGGKNISAAQVENEIAAHPSVAIAAAVAVPDDLFGERVAVYVQLVDGTPVFGFEEMTEHLVARGTSKEMRPEFLHVLESMPRSSGGKVAKGELSEDAKRRFGSH